jgi:hypothetical protein
MKTILPRRTHKDQNNRVTKTPTQKHFILKKREEGEIPPENPRKSGRRTNKEVREEATSKEKAQGKQQSIENSMYTSTQKAGTKGSDHLAYGSRASSTPRQ